RLRPRRHPDVADDGPGERRGQRRLEARRRDDLRGAVRADAAAPVARALVGVGGAVPRRRPRLLLVPSRLAREPRVLGVARRPPQLAALQPVDRAAPDVGADDVPAVLAAAGPARLPAVDDPARPELVAD